MPRPRRKKEKKGRPKVKSVEWIKHKKERSRRLGKEVKTDSKFTGRRRPSGF
ncbi:hypothetical protein EON65_39760 [archaeon]|nr:MAG: hypothetical protein EON65_39760 [archaeon]